MKYTIFDCLSSSYINPKNTKRKYFKTKFAAQSALRSEAKSRNLETRFFVIWES